MDSPQRQLETADHPREADIRVRRDPSGEFHLVRARSPRGRSWIERNIPGPAVAPGGEMLIGPEFLGDLVAWMRADGLRVAVGTTSD